MLTSSILYICLMFIYTSTVWTMKNRAPHSTNKMDYFFPLKTFRSIPSMRTNNFNFKNSSDRFSWRTVFRARSNIFMNCRWCLCIPLSIGHVIKHSVYTCAVILFVHSSENRCSLSAHSMCTVSKTIKLAIAV